MAVLAPADFVQARTALLESRTLAGPVYFRLGKNETEAVPELDGCFRLGGVEQIGTGRDVAIVATGSITREAAAAVDLLETRGWRSRLVVAACLSPSPAKALVTSLSNVSLAVTVEAHYLSGGLGSLVSEVVAESGLGCRVVRCGVASLPDEVGTEAFLNEAHGLSASAIARVAADALDQPGTPASPVLVR
jgi:transketolase